VTQPIEAVIARWHEFMRGDAPNALGDLLADDVVFYSPVVYTPQRGKDVTTLYLRAAGVALPGNDGEGAFRYTKQVLAGDTAVLEFETTIDRTYVNGVDIIRCDSEGRIVEFRVMIRPLQAVNAVHEQMRAQLEQMSPD
jgi:ketosteroid isomerase-like protein